MSDTAKTPRPAKAAKPATPAAPVADRKRAAHVLGRPGEDGALLEVELFTGELAARRALDSRPDWKYLHLIPGQCHVARTETVTS